jgi:protease I
MSHTETPRAVILTADRFEDLEVLYPYFRLLEEGIHVDISAPNKEQLHGEHGYGVEPTKTMRY